MTKKDHSRSERIFRALLRLFPFDFRWKHGREMEQVFRERRKEEERQGGAMGTLKLWWETLVDIARTAPREHLEMLAQDAGYALRLMRKNLGFTTVAVLTLALGIGANTAIFSVVNAILLRPLPFHEGDRLVRIYQVPKGGSQHISLRQELFLAVKEQGQFFEDIVGQRYMSLTLAVPEGPERIAGLGVTEGWLRTLGVKLVLGRDFTPPEQRAGTDSQVVLISHGFWERRFGLDRSVLGQSLTINRQSYTVVGVLPPGFAYPYNNELWIPMRLDRTPSSMPWALNVQARLKPGTTLSAARTELSILAERLAREFPESSQGMDLIAVPTRQVLLGDHSDVVLALFVAVGFVLLIVCANVANLLLARSVVRQKEFAIRASLGASRVRQVRQLLTENVLLAFFGGIAGLTMAVLGSQFLTVLVPGRMVNLLSEVSIDLSVLGFTLIVALSAGVIFGLTSALRASRSDLQNLLKEGGRSSGTAGSHRLLGALVVSEIALALVLLAGAGLMIRNFQRLHRADLGYPVQGLITMSVSLASSDYAAPQTRTNFIRQVEEQLEAVPGIQAAGMTCIFPLPPANFLASVLIEGRPLTPNQQLIINHRLVTPGFFRAMGIPLLRGRLLAEADNQNSQPVAVISETMAHRYWPGEDPLGKQVRNVRAGDQAPWLTVVGIVGDVQEPGEISSTWYLPYAQHAQSRAASSVIFVVRGASDLSGLVGGLRRAVWAVDPAMPVYDIATVEGQYADTLSQQRLGTLLVGLFAAFGLLMAGLGIYGVMSYAVSQRTHEIGIRMALGAQPGDIMRWILRQGILLVLLGVMIGLGGAMALTRFMSSLLSEVEATDPVTFAGVAFLLAAVALLACYIPARRATKVDPMVALRCE